MEVLQRAACIGGGVIGGGWVARLLLNGVDVAVFDPDPQAQRKVNEVLEGAQRAYAGLTDMPLPVPGTLRFCATLAEAVAGAQLIQESAPERLELKRGILNEIDQHADAQAIIGSSTSGLLPSDLQSQMSHPQRLLVAHPYNPVYLLPLVELVAGNATQVDRVAKAKHFYSSLGMKAVVIRKEIDAFVGDRLLEAVWREALWLVRDDVATVEEIDDVIRYSFGLRWAQMGLFQVYRIAGGEEGMRHFIEQFGPSLKWPWTKLMDVPELDEALVEKIVSQSDAQNEGVSIRELERIRDDNLIAIMRGLKGNDWGAGALLKAYEGGLREEARKVEG